MEHEMIRMAVYSILLNMIIECLNRRSLIGLVQFFTNPVIFFYNTLIIFLTMSVALLFKRKVFVYSVVSFLWLMLAVINFLVLYSRKTPFTAMDIYLVNDAIKVIPIYLNMFEIILIILAVGAAIFGLIRLWKKGPLSEQKVPSFPQLAKFVLIFAVYMGVTKLLLFTGFLSSYFGNLANAYKEYGFAYCFTCSVIDRGISKSDDYTTEYVNSLREELDTEDSGYTDTTRDTPNIIFLQLESFFDPNLVKGIKISENPVPNFEKLVAEYSSGYLSVPCFGAGTANTEFEVQTGMNIDDFGPGEYPYRTILQSKVCESMAYDLLNLGYSTHALHNNDATFYDRYKVFSHLGYENFTSIEYMPSAELTPMGWAKDYILTEEIDKILDSTEGADYIYTISVQGHGDYPQEYPEGFVPSILVSGFFDEDNEKAFTYYVNQIHEMDIFIGELIENLSERDEETVLVMYGDHLPTFNFTDDTLKNGDIYQTQYVIWSNFDMSVEKKDLEAFQLSAHVFEKLNISEGYLTKFHQKQADSADYLKNLKILEYDILYGNCDIYGGTNPYGAMNLTMGTGDITITSAYQYKNDICIEGTNFNDYSVVFIGNKEYAAELVNPRLLRIKNASLQTGNIVSVVQRGTDKIELGRVYLEITD
jgi:phosphoglycerol transferase MdoB-like AlkP superfamily enzyme